MVSWLHTKYLFRCFLRKLGFHPKPNTWLRARRNTLKRDNYTCQTCGFRSRHKITVHHINRDHSDNRLENLITECRPCHDKIDGIEQQPIF